MEKNNFSFTGIIVDPIGLHARPAAALVKAANQFQAKINLLCDGKEANLKSIMNVLALGVKSQKEVTIQAHGKDAHKAIAELEQIMHKEHLI